jgi:peptidoglycan hydrolase-like protein with peptidoglycan-binding domain/LysM repeat protein
MNATTLRTTPASARPTTTRPDATAAPSERPSEVTVQRGDTVTAIAARHEVTVDALVEENPQLTDPNLIHPGQVLRVPARAAPPAEASSTPTAAPPTAGPASRTPASDETVRDARRRAAAAEGDVASRLRSATDPSVPAPGLGEVEGGRAVYARGQSGPEVRDLQERLTRLGFGVQTTGVFGPTTEGVVKDFQKANGVGPTGQVGKTTLDALARAELQAVRDGKFALQNGEQGGGVKLMQEALTKAGFGVQATGIFGVTTEKTLKDFQRAKGIEPDGVFGQNSARALVGGGSAAGPVEGVSGAGAGTTPRIDQHRLPHARNWAFCGVASTMMVLRSQGQASPATRANLEAIAGQMYIPGQGTSGAAMARYLSDRGIPSRYTTTGTSADIVAGLKEGRPVPLGVIDFGGQVQKLDGASARYPGLREGQSYNHQFGASGHWVTVTGFEGPPKNPTHFIANDPDTGATVRLSRAQLERHAGGAGNMWMVTLR